MDSQANKRSLLAEMLFDLNKNPIDLPLSLLKDITNNFSDDQKIGEGGFAVVYKGLLDNGSIAVKRLSQTVDMDEKFFNEEVRNLIRLKHKNIVRFLGYCADTQGKIAEYDGKMVMADVRKRLLCFEFMPNGGLDKHIGDASEGLEWRTRYQIIKGICEGLHYLHQQKTVHLDLKPANILLDCNMVPKIADFGLSRFIDESKSREKTKNVFGTMGYMAPEFINNGLITFKSDIYSLGVIIIEILTGKKGDLQIENVLESWSTRFQASQGGAWPELLTLCAEIGMQCKDSCPENRPTIQDILEMLQKMEGTCGFNETHQSATHLSKEKTVPGNPSTATSIVGSASIDNPLNVHFTPQSQGTVNLTLYMHQTIGGPNYNQVNIANKEHPGMFGCTIVHECPIYDSLDPRAKIVARVQGLHTKTSMNDDDCWFHWGSIVFSDERFLGSSFVAIGNQNKIEGEWVIVGGTGIFTFAQGTITISRKLDSGFINEICIRAVCCTGQTTPMETKPFQDKRINIYSNASTNVCGPSMANPQSSPVTSQPLRNEYNRILYMYQIISGPDYNQANIADPMQPQMFGYTNVHDYPIYDSLGPAKKIVARAQGLHTKTSMNHDGWFHWSKIAFDYERFQGSSINAIGNQEGEWAIVGGTGDFTFAQGTVTTRRIRDSGSWNIKEIHIHAFCCAPITPTDTKPSQDKMTNIYSNAATNVCGHCLANPQSSPVNSHSLRNVYHRILYMYQIISGPDYNQVNIADPMQPQMFGYTNVHDYPIYDSLGPGKKIVARAQGLHTKTSMNHDGWFHWSSVVFSDERSRFHGSSLKAIGNQEGEWAIVGGTGEFTLAQGTVTTCRIQDNGFSNIKEIRIHAFYCTNDHSN